MDRLRKTNNRDIIIHWYDIHIKFNFEVNEIVKRPFKGATNGHEPKTRNL